MFKVYFVNLEFYAPYGFNTLEDAYSYVKTCGWESIIYDANNRLIASWSIIGGLWKEAS